MDEPIHLELMKAAVAAARMDARIHKVGVVLLRGTPPNLPVLRSLLEDILRGPQHFRNEGDYLLAVGKGGQPWPSDHAESGLLGHLLRNENLQGATLYVTLEPCVSTRHWVRNREMCCCEIIAKAGIGQVFVGMRDPNPAIYRRGLMRLEMDRIPVMRFPEQLQREIEELNKPWIDLQSANWKYDQIFAALEGNKGPRLQGKRGVAVNDALSMLLCPDIKQGWKASQIRVLHDPTPLAVNERDAELYELYRKVFYEKKGFENDNPKVMLTRHAWDTSDAGSLKLHTGRTKYSYIQFYKDIVSATDERRARLLDEIEQLHDGNEAERRSLVQGIHDSTQLHSQRVEELMARFIGPSDKTLEFPHALCLHIAVATKDGKLLITCRAPQSEYRPSTWSCSLEEHMAVPDLNLAHDGTVQDGAVLRWAQRALREEFGLQKETYDSANVRILSLFLESDILNIALCCWVKLNIDSRTLAAILRGVPHVDDEMTAWDFLDYSEPTLISEILWARQVTSYHPTSQFRMLMTLMKKKGWPRHAHKWLPEWPGGLSAKP
jgi:pyrimidine deaminase RibD-like protein